MKFLFLFASVLYAQQPPAIMVTPGLKQLFATLIADVPIGTSVLPVVTVGKTRSLLPPFQITKPGPYLLATGPVGAQFGAYITPPNGETIRLRGQPLLRGYSYDGTKLTLFGSFNEQKVFVYLATSPMPQETMASKDRLTIPIAPTENIIMITINQSGICDSLSVRLMRTLEGNKIVDN